VATHFISGGVDSGGVATLGFGVGYRAAPNDPASGRQLNRGVDYLLKAMPM
jgi:outer membrane protein OmpA-like peptidoglycan-associated protein